MSKHDLVYANNDTLLCLKKITVLQRASIKPGATSLFISLYFSLLNFFPLYFLLSVFCCFISDKFHLDMILINYLFTIKLYSLYSFLFISKYFTLLLVIAIVKILPQKVSLFCKNISKCLCVQIFFLSNSRELTPQIFSRMTYFLTVLSRWKLL